MTTLLNHNRFRFPHQALGFMDLLKIDQNAFLVIILVAICPIFAGFVLKYLWRPWMIYRALKKHGFKGPPPRFMIGNLVEIANLLHQPMLTDMPSINHDIGNRISPYIAKWSQIYGERFFIWFGYEPSIVITDADLLRELLSSKHSADCGRSPMTKKMLSLAMGNGLFTANGQKWSHQRRIMAPAFHMEKLNVITTFLLDSSIIPSFILFAFIYYFYTMIPFWAWFIK